MYSSNYLVYYFSAEERIMKPSHNYYCVNKESFSKQPMQQIYLKELLDVLDAHPGPKNLLIDNDLVNSINLILQIQTLQEHKVVHVGNLTNHNRQPITTFYLIKNASLQLALEVVDKSCQNIILLTPKLELRSQFILEQTDYPHYTIPLFWSVLEQDVLSLEQPCFKSLFVYNDPSVLHDLSNGLIQFINCHGTINTITAKGDYAVQFKDLLLKQIDINTVLQKRQQTTKPPTAIPANQFYPITTFEPPTGQMTHTPLDIFLFDRSIDFITPLLKQLTYSGLLSEYCNVQCGHLDPDAPIYDVTKPLSNSKFKLGGDAIYDEIKDVNFVALGTTLNKLAKSLKQDYESRNQANTVAQIKSFVKQLGHLQNDHKSLRIHTNIAELLQKDVMDDDFHKLIEIQQAQISGNDAATHLEFVEEMIYRNVQINDLIRLLCLISILNDGLKKKQFDWFKREMMGQFGMTSFEMMDELHKAHLLIKKEDGIKSNYKTLKKQFQLYVENTNEMEPTDVSFVMSGIAPLIPRIMEGFMENGVDMSLIKTIHGEQATYTSNVVAHEVDEGDEDDLKMTVVVLIGGVTQAEIGALRWLFRDKEPKLMILTTHILTPDFYKR